MSFLTLIGNIFAFIFKIYIVRMSSKIKILGVKDANYICLFNRIPGIYSRSGL